MSSYVGCNVATSVAMVPPHSETGQHRYERLEMQACVIGALAHHHLDSFTVWCASSQPQLRDATMAWTPMLSQSNNVLVASMTMWCRAYFTDVGALQYSNVLHSAAQV